MGRWDTKKIDGRGDGRRRLMFHRIIHVPWVWRRHFDRQQRISSSPEQCCAFDAIVFAQIMELFGFPDRPTRERSEP
jgi:hypothetical protein